MRTEIVSLAALAERADAAALIAEADARAVSQQWASHWLLSHEPLWFERHQHSRGRQLAAQPDVTQDALLYSFDARGEVVRVRSWSGFLKRWHEDEVFRREGDVVTGYRFDAKGKPMNVDRYTYDGQRLMTHEKYAVRAKRSGRESYVWDGAKLLRVDVENWGHSWALTWHGEQLEVIAAVYAEGASEVWRRPRDEESLEVLLPRIRDRWLAGAVALLDARQTFTHVAVVLDEEAYNHLLPPSLALGTDAQRGEFNPAELTELHVDDAELLTLSVRANQLLWSEGRYDAAQAFCRELATALRARWPGVLVYATSLDADHASDAASASSTGT